MKTQFKVGDVIKFDRSSKKYAVVESAVNVSLDELRGDRYSVEEFKAIELSDHRALYSDAELKDLQFIYHPYKVKSFYFKDGSMSGKGKGVEREAVKKVGKCKVNKEVTVTYLLSNVAA